MTETFNEGDVVLFDLLEAQIGRGDWEMNDAEYKALKKLDGKEGRVTSIDINGLPGEQYISVRFDALTELSAVSSIHFTKREVH